jgi:5-methylcytosine-specific restriction enzyme subunit McrC
MNSVTTYEFDLLVPDDLHDSDATEFRAVPKGVFAWLERQCLQSAERGDAAWLRLTQRRGRKAVQVTSYVGVIRAPDGFQIEVLPKVGHVIGGGDVEARRLLIQMLRCLNGFRHIQTDSADLAAARMPLLEVFIREFLQAVENVVKQGLRSDYSAKQDNLFALRGKLLVADHLRQNLFRADRFFTDHDEFTTNRPDNRLLHAALHQALVLATSQENQQLARELCFAFADVPKSTQIAQDFQRVRRERGASSYSTALAWARLILEDESPLTGVGGNRAPSLLFPMEAVFEAYVAKHLSKQLVRPMILKTQACSHHLVRHSEQNWFLLKPDILVRQGARDTIVLDTKWKLLDDSKASGSQKYGLAQGDFYQLHAYGQAYLDGCGDMILIYPKTATFNHPLPVFTFPKAGDLRLWVLPFCLTSKALLVPAEASFASAFCSVA